MSALNDQFMRLVYLSGLPEPEREFRFHPTRRWRFDFAWPAQMVAVEIDGGIFVAGGHNRGAQILKDMEKRNEALILGWRVLRVGRQHLRSGEAILWTRKLIEREESV